jgi:ketosteroid isomerase-like protein
MEAAHVSLESQVQRLQDRMDIQELLHAYCRHADQLNTEGMAGFFTDDCVAAYVPPGMAPAFRSKKQLVDFLNTYFLNTISSSHHISNVELLFDSPDIAKAHTYMYSWQRFKGFPAAADCHRWGRYEIRLQRTAGGWKMTHMILISAGEYGGARIGEQFGRPWPPRFDQ